MMLFLLLVGAIAAKVVLYSRVLNRLARLEQRFLDLETAVSDLEDDVYETEQEQ